MGTAVKIGTDRLEIIVLTVEQLRTLIYDIPSLEKELNVSYRAEPIEGIFKEIVKVQLEAAENDPDNCVWYSFWLIIRKTDGTVIGSAVFKGPPNDTGTVEIGYGLGKEFEKNGYMTEAITALCDWTLEDKNVSRITAVTDIYNYASQRILKKCSFKISDSRAENGRIFLERGK